MQVTNSYEDIKRAEAYAKLEFPGTYHLAYRDLPEIIHRHVKGKKAIDFGCGTGRSTRFFRDLGFQITGIDISEQMILKAKEFEPTGDYRIIEDGNFAQFQLHSYDLVTSIFTFDNVPVREKRQHIFKGLANLLNSKGTLINLVSSPEMYFNEWASFSTKDFPENKNARSGDIVKIINTDIDDLRPVDDMIWWNEDYLELFEYAGLKCVATYRPLAKGDEGFKWVKETHTAPWVIYVLQRQE